MYGNVRLTIRVLIGVSAALSGCALAIALGQAKESAAAGTAGALQDGAKLVRGYRSWARVNPTPVQMQPAASALCIPPSPDQEPSPHLRKYVTVYVSALGKEAMLRQAKPQFPAGTVIVKEKLARAGSKTPELLTAMVKRTAGYAPGSGDWEYLTLDGSGARVTARGNLETCRSCHARPPALLSDHVFRAYYMTDSQRSALK